MWIVWGYGWLSCLSCVYAVLHGCGDGEVIHVCGGGGALAVLCNYVIGVLNNPNR